ncbi:S phase cyclin A-associated protein in the endoplasmic reticulum [Nasonia vitripennis]|uniref:C2H2-type domain-containing protein n=1 Tax=Nasonia vitripennis TaxID=7425 RepID=A0A7M7GD04_NASVI|nr:S phase cyclin A-associated protein in the endoplasmic reticulum [Nasonia vitripennis]XP_008213444.1 S phase cyclin A-associated protein in the endoplasmic reticulum [Nasonia vitripennis]
MADVRLLVQEEGRAARNLIAFNVPLETDGIEKITRKPPSVPRVLLSTATKRSIKSNARVRSASTGRDKRSELQARYWAFLFGNLQRAVDAIYETCEEDENISECKEVILVLENYTRDFHNLIEWFKVKWAYETSPPPLRRTPLAWEVRKTSPCRMWSVPKPGSPLQRMSPISPIEQTIIEHKVTSNPSDNRNEPTGKAEVTPRNPKIVKDAKNQGSKNDAKSLKEKQPVVAKVNSTRSSTVLKRTSSANKTQESESKVLAETNGAKSNVIDPKSSNVVRNVSRTQPTTATRTKSAADSQNVNNENNVDSGLKRNNEPRNSIEATKNVINTNFNKGTPANGLSVPDSKTTTTCNNKSPNKSTVTSTVKSKVNPPRPAYSTISRMKSTLSSTTSSQLQQQHEVPKMVRSKTTLGVMKGPTTPNKMKPGTSVIVRRRMQAQGEFSGRQNSGGSESSLDMSASCEVLTPHSRSSKQNNSQHNRQNQNPQQHQRNHQSSGKEVDVDGWQTVRGRCRRGSTHNLNMSTRFHKPSTASSLPALCIDSSKKTGSAEPSASRTQKRRSVGTAKSEGDKGKMCENTGTGDKTRNVEGKLVNGDSKGQTSSASVSNETNNSTSLTIAAIFKSEAELLEKRIQQFMAAQAERERIILEEERKTEEADSQRSKQLSDEEASLQRQILELESSEIDIDTETDETDGEMVLDVEEDIIDSNVEDEDISLEDRYENMLEGMSWAERMDTLAQLQALVARHPGRALELHQKLSSPSRKRSLPETLRRYQAKQACAQHKRQKLLMEKSQRLRELLNKVEDVKTAKNQLIEDKRIRLELKLKRAEENRTQHLLEIVRKAHDEDSKLKEIAFINELEAQNKRHDFMALCQEQEERLQGIQEERQRRQEEKAAKEAAAEERRRALEAERQLRIQRMRQARREREERVGKMQLEREKERQELAREKARDREERLSALHAAQLANQEELQKKIAQKQQESARRHVENIEHIRQRAVESSILRAEEVPPTLKSYPSLKQCALCGKVIPNEVHLLSHLKGKLHSEAVRRVHDGREPNRDELQKFNIAQIKDLPTGTTGDNKAAKEKQKALKRRSRKIKQRMTARSQEYEDSTKATGNGTAAGSDGVVDSTNKSKFRRNLKELDKLCQNHAKTTWSVVAVASLERCLGEIARGFSKSCPLDQDTFSQLRGFETLTNLLNLGLNIQNTSQTLPNKSIVSVCRVYISALNGHSGNVEAVFLSNKIIVILDLLMQRLEAVTSLDDNSQAQEMTASGGNGSVVVAAVQLLCSLVPETPFEKPALQSRLQDVVGYLMTSGLIDRVSRHSRAMIESDYLLDQERDCLLLVGCYDLLFRICVHLKRSGNDNNGSLPSSADTSETSTSATCNSEPSTAQAHLLNLLGSSEAAGVVGALYAAIALTSASSSMSFSSSSGNTCSAAGQRGGSSGSPTPSHQQAGPSATAKSLAWKGLKLLRSIAELDLQKLQNMLGAEGTSLQWRMTACHLIARLSRDLPDLGKLQTEGTNASGAANQGVNGTQLLGQLFVVLGYFAVNNPDNQLILQSAGAGPSVLQQLCTLPFPFYGDPRLAGFTLPTLLAGTHENPEAKAILSCEMSYQLLEEYRDSEQGKLNPLVRLLRGAPSNPP